MSNLWGPLQSFLRDGGAYSNQKWNHYKKVYAPEEFLSLAQFLIDSRDPDSDLAKVFRSAVPDLESDKILQAVQYVLSLQHELSLALKANGVSDKIIRGDACPSALGPPKQ